ncbi:ATP-binding protein [Endozoicomonas sp.]|uniref:ATP-binding protein n=1 Tax=Endozoicomonas sp. TaxID=1892382 RepID=UPI003AF81F22
MKQHSIRRFLLIGLLSTMTLAQLVTMTWSYHESYLEAEELQDAQLVQYARALSLMLTSNLNKNEIMTVPIQIDPEEWQGAAAGLRAHKYEGKLFFKIFTENKQLLAHSENTPDFWEFPLVEGFRNINTAGHDWRVFTLHITRKNSWIITAQRGDIRGEMGGIIALKSILPFLFTFPMVFLMIGWLVNKGLQPVIILANELKRREANDLHPVPINNPAKELIPLISSINQLLKRLSDAFNRERQFVGYAVHELRTPLAGLGVHLQNAIKKQGHEKDKAIDLSLKGHQRMAHLVEQLLILARTTPDAYLATFQTVDLYKVCQRVIADNIQLILDKRQTITLEGTQPAVIQGDDSGLNIMISNLVRNAALYTPDEGTIKLSVTVSNQQTILCITDTGPGIPQKLRRKVFDRFYRADSDRHASNVEGAGLGLSIVAHVIELHGATIKLGTAASGGLEVIVRFEGG